MTKVVENILSLSTGEQVGSANEPVDSFDSRFAALNGREYLLVMERGTRLTIYAITNESSYGDTGKKMGCFPIIA